jgi:hypothetical protein
LFVGKANKAAVAKKWQGLYKWIFFAPMEMLDVCGNLLMSGVVQI